MMPAWSTTSHATMNGLGLGLGLGLGIGLGLGLGIGLGFGLGLGLPPQPPAGGKPNEATAPGRPFWGGNMAPAPGWSAAMLPAAPPGAWA